MRFADLSTKYYSHPHCIYSSRREKKMGKRSFESSAGLLLSPQTAKISRIEVAMEESVQIP